MRHAAINKRLRGLPSSWHTLMLVYTSITTQHGLAIRLTDSSVILPYQGVGLQCVWYGGGGGVAPGVIPTSSLVGGLRTGEERGVLRPAEG